MTTEVLLVEDDPYLGKVLKVNLEQEGYQVHWAQNLKDAEEVNRSQGLNLIVLDLNLPDGNGLTLLRTIRKGGSRIPVIVLTAKVDEESVVEGLQAGANDYVRKPFGQKELLARVQTALKAPRSPDEQLRYGDLLLLVEQRKVMFDGKELDLLRREYDVLAYFIEHAEAVVTRPALLNFLDKDGEIFDRTIDSHVSHVRSKLKKANVVNVQINSIYGVGYRMEKA
jgi:two-component system OmpR family response regulator